MLQLLRNLLVIGSSSIIQAVVVFAKGVVLARALGVHQFGLSVIIISITGALDMFADAGIDRYIVQSRFGFRNDIVSTSHSYRVFGSGLVGACIILISYPLSLVFKAPELWGPIAATGGIVILRGFINLSYKLQQRQHRFEQETIIDSARVLVDIAVTALVAVTTHSFVAALFGSYANALTQLVMSHMMASRPYSFRPRRQLVRLVGRFSIPIYLNATMLFAAMQGDRLVVAAMYTKREVAMYAVACTLGQGLTTLIGKVAERILLPMFRPHGDGQHREKVLVNGVGALFVAGSFLFEIAICTISPFATKLIYGHEYVNLSAIIFAASIFQMTQIEQAWINSVVMARGLTVHFPKITLMRSFAFPTAILFSVLGFSIISVPIAFALGAALSLAMSYYSVRKLRLIDLKLPLVSFSLIGISIISVIALVLSKHIN